jgi:hypothetical protein
MAARQSWFRDWQSGKLAMDSRARRSALIIAATVALAAFVAKPTYGCDATRGCPSDASNLGGVAANALPTYPETTEQAAEPIKLKKFTKPQVRTAARRAQPRKATLSQRAQGSKLAKAKQTEQDAQDARAATARKVTPAVANANAELVEVSAGKPADKTLSADQALAPARTIDATALAQPAAGTQTAAVQPPTVELVSADEFNDLDRAAWEANQMPKLMQLTGSTSHAELRDDDSRWAQTSTIGKLFVAFGALLTIGSAIRMFMA